MHMSPLECDVTILDVCPIYTYVVCLRFVREGLISSKVANFVSGSKSGKKAVTLAPVLVLLHTIILFSRKNTNFGLNLNRGSFFLFVLWKSTSFRSGGPNLDGLCNGFKFGKTAVILTWVWILSEFFFSFPVKTTTWGQIWIMVQFFCLIKKHKLSIRGSEFGRVCAMGLSYVFSYIIMVRTSIALPT